MFPTTIHNHERLDKQPHTFSTLPGRHHGAKANPVLAYPHSRIVIDPSRRLWLLPLDPAANKIFEDILCRQYYAAHPIHPSEQNCKIAPVQNELARINGWKDTFDALPSILVAIPYGALADPTGRKPCLLLPIPGVLLIDIWTRLICGFS